MRSNCPLHTLTLSLASILFTEGAGAQSVTAPAGTVSRPVVGGSGGTSPQPPLISGSQNLEILRHRDPAGKPCLTVSGFARPHTTTPNLFDHMITVSNSCAQLIRIQVCYYHTQYCVSAEISGHIRKEMVLGMLPSIKDFRYEFRERF
jgi:hypothetical protein